MTAPVDDTETRIPFAAGPGEQGAGVSADAQDEREPEHSRHTPDSDISGFRTESDPTAAPVGSAQAPETETGRPKQPPSEDPGAGTGEGPPAAAEHSAGTPAQRGAPQVDVHADTNQGLMVGQWFESVQRHSGAPLPAKWVDQQLANYLPIDNEKEADERLKRDRVLVLVADGLGSGRLTAALRLLHTRDGVRLTLRRVRRETGDSFSMEGLRGHKETGWILDLRDPEESLPATCDLGLELCDVDDLENDGSYLIVLVGTELWNRIGHDAGSLALVPQPPDGVMLFVHYLTRAGVANPGIWAEDHRFSKDLPRLRPGQIKKWADAVALSESQYLAAAGGGSELSKEGFEKVAQTAGHVLSGWIDVLAEWHSFGMRTSYERNYLLLAAVYDGEPIEGVHRKIASLATRFGEKGERAEPLSGQQGPGLIQLARQIEAEPLPDGSIRFPGPGFAEAVVRYFWRDRPELIDAFTKWTAQLCLELKHPQGSQLAARMAPWVLHHVQATRKTRLLRLVITGWAADENLTPHAHELLVAASLDPQIGQMTLKAIGTWGSHAETTAELQKTLARVFQSLAPVHPQRMLRRLGELALSREPGVAEAVGEAINHLWGDDQLRPKLLPILTGWFGSGQESLRKAAGSAFMNLALQLDNSGQPTLLGTSGTPVADWVLGGWRAVLEADEPSNLARRACTVWLDAAAVHNHATERTLDTLVRAVHETATVDLRGQRFLNLVRLAEHWMLQGGALDEEGRNEIRADLMRRTSLADPHRAQTRSGPPGV
ncbi:hypothetical protein [Streptomyces sp. 11-1-2]|uniref:hypothetical protein n=1 Tax=unclassified Streptomyces TaxID=2593676 RepID=UPI000B8D6114|nr:hypothetical protein [Streptomyces sp. 11-1-2]ASQ96488.1 hypothetical protein CGL27_28625 [Streptomyces sp. 11-1-2]